MEQIFDSGPCFGAMVQNRPKIENCYSFYSFEARNLIPSEYNQLTTTKQIMEHNFDMGPSFWTMAQGPKTAISYKSNYS